MFALLPCIGARGAGNPQASLRSRVAPRRPSFTQTTAPPQLIDHVRDRALELLVPLRIDRDRVGRSSAAIIDPHPAVMRHGGRGDPRARPAEVKADAAGPTGIGGGPSDMLHHPGPGGTIVMPAVDPRDVHPPRDQSRERARSRYAASVGRVTMIRTARLGGVGPRAASLCWRRSSCPRKKSRHPVRGPARRASRPGPKEPRLPRSGWGRRGPRSDPGRTDPTASDPAEACEGRDA